MTFKDDCFTYRPCLVCAEKPVHFTEYKCDECKKESEEKFKLRIGFDLFLDVTFLNEVIVYPV